MPIDDLVRLLRSGINRPIQGLRTVVGDPETFLVARAGNLDPVGARHHVVAARPTLAVASGYADPERALAIARKADLQILDDSPVPGYGLPRDFPGLERDEYPLRLYEDQEFLRPRDRTVGLATADLFSPGIGRQAEVSVLGRSGEDVAETVRHELGHLLDPLLYEPGRFPSVKFLSTDGTNYIKKVLPDQWQSARRYWSNVAETRATLSRIRRLISEDFLPTDSKGARSMLQAVVDENEDSKAREIWTALSLLNSKRNFSDFLPWMTGALGVGGVMAGSEE